MPRTIPMDPDQALLPNAMYTVQRGVNLGPIYPRRLRFVDAYRGYKDRVVLRAARVNADATGVQAWQDLTPWMQGLHAAFEGAFALEMRDTVALQHIVCEKASALQHRKANLLRRKEAQEARIAEGYETTDAPTTLSEEGQSPQERRRRRAAEHVKRVLEATESRDQDIAQRMAADEELAALRVLFAFHADALRQRSLALASYYERRQATYARVGLGGREFSRSFQRLPRIVVPECETGVLFPRPVLPTGSGDALGPSET